MVFQGLLQPRTKYLRKTLVFMWGGGTAGGVQFLLGVFCGCWHNTATGNFFFVLEGRGWEGSAVGYTPWNFDIIEDCELWSLIRSATRTHQFITNNQASFHLWGKGKLVKHQNMIKHDLLLYLMSFMLSY